MRRSPRLIGTVGLLVLALVVAAVLAYQAWDAAASQRLTAETELPYADLAWVRDTMVAYTKALGPLRDTQILAFGSPDGRFGPFKNLALVLTNDSYAMLFGERNRKP